MGVKREHFSSQWKPPPCHHQSLQLSEMILKSRNLCVKPLGQSAAQLEKEEANTAVVEPQNFIP